MIRWDVGPPGWVTMCRDVSRCSGRTRGSAEWWKQGSTAWLRVRLVGCRGFYAHSNCQFHTHQLNGPLHPNRKGLAAVAAKITTPRYLVVSVANKTTRILMTAAASMLFACRGGGACREHWFPVALIEVHRGSLPNSRRRSASAR